MNEATTVTLEAPATSGLKPTLLDFQERFNTNPRVKKLIKKWEREIMLDATDTGALHTMVVQGQELREIVDGKAPSGDQELLVHLQAEEATLKDIFSGEYNPATAVIDGVLSVFSKERDKIKLEALAMVIWGL